jgi:hypothetical protein
MFLILNALIFEIIGGKKFYVDLFKDMFTNLFDCFIDDLDDGFWFELLWTTCSLVELESKFFDSPAEMFSEF